jgi:hypothetical protein
MRSRFYALMVAISKVWLATNKSGLGDVAASAEQRDGGL